MKTIKQFIQESLFDDEDDLATNDIPIIESFLKNNYTISGDVNIREENGIYIVDVDGDVDIKNYNLKKLTLPIFKFGRVEGSFDCSESDIESLEGCPAEVVDLIASYCLRLKTLEGIPDSVPRIHIEGCTKITSLEGVPKKCGGIVCNECPIKTLKGAPQECVTFFCTNCNLLKDLTGAPKKCKLFNCSMCTSLESLKGAPRNVDQLICKGCPMLTDFADVPEKVITKE